MHVHKLDHIVLAVADIPRTRAFYERVLGMRAEEERPGKWCLLFGSNKISLHEVGDVPAIAQGTIRGSGNFCMLTDTPIEEVTNTLAGEGIEIVASGERHGGAGRMMSVYFKDPDGNLIEVSRLL
jgi:catechol 2,3-dioxygenase-like lactoylglutathione lyase family enzyme